MDLKQAITDRRSIFKFTDQLLPVDKILPLLVLANLAPNHHLTQPWRFICLGEKTKIELSAIYGHARATKKVAVDSPLFADEYQRAVNKFLQTPAIVMVSCRVDANPLIAEEDYAATCCAIQNLLLAETDAGLGAQWSSHPMIHMAEVTQLLSVSEDERLVAMIYMGYPAVIPAPPPRKPLENFLRVLP